MTTAKLKKILDELRGALSEHYGERLSKLVLFGSQARGMPKKTRILMCWWC